jgi:hypothetical protein
MTAVIFISALGEQLKGGGKNGFNLTVALVPTDELHQGSPQKGTGPRPPALRLTTWNEWRKQHPATLVGWLSI